MRTNWHGRVWPLAGLAVLAGGTTAAIATESRPFHITLMLVVVAAGMAYALLDEVRLQARRDSGGWTRSDTVNVGVLAVASAIAGYTAALAGVPERARLVGSLLAFGFGLLACAFVRLRRRAVAAGPPRTAR